jgi:hypothetical protein
MVCMTDFIQSHTVLNQQGYSGIKKTNVALEDKILFGLSRYAGFEVPQPLLGWKGLST